MVFLLSGRIVGVVVTLLVKMIADQQGLQPFCFLSFNFERPRAGLKTLKWRKLDQDRLAGSFNEETWSGHTDHTRGKHNQGDFTPNFLQLFLSGGEAVPLLSMCNHQVLGTGCQCVLDNWETSKQKFLNK